MKSSASRLTTVAVSLLLFCSSGCDDDNGGGGSPSRTAMAMTPTATAPTAMPTSTSTPTPPTPTPTSVTQIPFEDAKIIIELNATDEDVGVQILLDGERWEQVEVVNPDGQQIFQSHGRGSVGEIGVTELFFESEEPSLAELPLDEFLALFPEGEYQFRGMTVDGYELVGAARFTHAIPDGPVLVSPAEGAIVNPNQTVIAWNPVADPPGSEIVEYEVIVEREDPLRPFDIHVPATVTSVTVSPEFLDPGTEYKFEVLAIEEGGNQTLSESFFETEELGPLSATGNAASGAFDAALQLGPVVQIPFEDAKIIIEFNDTNRAAGIQIFLDGEGWEQVEVLNPDGQTIFEATGQGSVGEIGGTELLFEGAEPALVDLPLEELFVLFPEGEYQFRGMTVEGDELVGAATLTHVIPCGPGIFGAGELNPEDAVIEWAPVTSNINPVTAECDDASEIEIVGYRVTVGGAFSVDLPASRTSVTVPPELLAPGTVYEFAVFAIAASGNQTIALDSFVTAK